MKGYRFEFAIIWKNMSKQFVSIRKKEIPPPTQYSPVEVLLISTSLDLKSQKLKLALLF